MKPRHHVSRSAIELIKRFEGYRRKSAQLADGRWTIGYGHTLTARQGAEVSEQDAEALLMYDLIAVAHSVNEWVFTPLTQNQFDALTAFAFNIGLDNFKRSSVLRRLNEGALIQAACAMELWRKADFEGERIVVDALVRRRSAEKTLFLTPLDGWVPAPSPLLRPNVDMDSMGLVPRQAPTALSAPMEGPLAIVERDLLRQEKPTVHPIEETANPAAEAAAAVTTRLAGIFTTEAAEKAPPAVAEVAAAPPRLVLEETEAPGLPPFPHTLAKDVERAFTLTPPPEEVFAPAERVEPPKLDLVAADESEPTLFDLAQDTVPAADTMLGLDTETAPEIEAEYEPRTSFTPLEDPVAEVVETPPAKPALLPALGLAGAGVALFGGCLVWAVNTPAAPGGGAFNPGTVVWLAGIAGVGLIGVAVYLLLDRLGRSEPESVEAILERDE